MFNSMYSTASALQANENAHAITAANLAHINVPGYRRGINIFETIITDNSGNQPGDTAEMMNGVQLLVGTSDFSQGPIRSTGRSLDVAIDGDAFLEIEGDNGQSLYTRNGTLHISESGQLVNASGMVVKGSAGAIQIPAEITPSQIAIGSDGTLTAADINLGKLKLVAFKDNHQLERAGTTLFRTTAGAEEKTAEATFQQGSLEMANTSAVDELISMMIGSRHFEASQRALRTIGEAVQQHTTSRG
jgi:flagellar basal body rod protein FlgG